MKERSSVMGLKHIIRLRGKMHTSQLQAAGLMQGGNMSRSSKAVKGKKHTKGSLAEAAVRPDRSDLSYR